jgi:putative replication protein rep
MQFKSTGKLYIKMEDFREKLDIPKSYRLSEITEQVLEVAKKELSTVLENFEYKKIKKGRTVVRIDFTFKPIKNFDFANDEVIEIIENNEIEETERIEILIEILEEKIAAEENKINRLQEQIKEFREKEYIDAADESINRDIENYLENNIVESNKKIMEYKKEIEDYKNQLALEITENTEVEDYNSLIEKILKEKNVYTKEVKEKILELKETNTDEEIYKEILNKIEEIKTKNIKNVSGYLNTCIKNLEIKKIEVIEKNKNVEEISEEKIEEVGVTNLLDQYK